MANRSKRKVIAEDTLKILEQGYYDFQGNRIELRDLIDRSVEGSFCLTPEEMPAVDRGNDTFQTKYSVANETTFAGVRHLLEEGYQNVTCLNFASAKNPGGGFLNGSQAQEEALARASALYPTLLENRTYYDANRAFPNPLYSDHMIFSPDVPVFRDDSDNLLPEPFMVNIITAPAVNSGAVQNNHPHLADQIPEVMNHRIDRVLRLALSRGSDALVLGAWGCGVFRNDPNEMAQWFEQCLQAKELEGRFKAVRFSVLARSKDDAILKAFQKFQGELWEE